MEGEARGLYSMDEAAAENLDDLELLTALGERYPNTTLLITLGARGVAVRIPGQSPKLSRPTAWMRWSIPLRPEIPLRGTLSVR